MNDQNKNWRLNKEDYISILVSVFVFFVVLILSKKSINSVGLGLDIFGFLLLYSFGLPSRFGTTWDLDPKSPRYKLAKTMSHIGFTSIIVGFGMQFYASVG